MQTKQKPLPKKGFYLSRLRGSMLPPTQWFGGYVLGNQTKNQAMFQCSKTACEADEFCR